MPESRKINWRVLFIEGATIAVSILLAFAVDAWWDNQRDREKLDNGLANLQAELRSNIERIDRYQKLHQNIVDAGVALLAAKPSEVTVDQCGHVFLQGWVTEYSTGALDIVLASTRLDLLEDQKLRAELMALPASYEDAIEDELWAIDELMGKWIPFISKIMPVGDLWALALPGVEFPVSGDTANADISEAAATLEFRNHVTNRIGFETLSIDAQRQLRQRLEALIARLGTTVESPRG